MDTIRDKDTDVGRYVQKRVNVFCKYSSLPKLREPQLVEWKDVGPNRPLLGKGAFSNVYRVQIEGDQQVYALKRLNSVMSASHKKFKTGASDLALEKMLLERLDHPHIITLHGVKDGELQDSINHRDYFLVLDFLVATLDGRMRQWRKETSGLVSKMNVRGNRKRLMDRIEYTALGVAKGMEYLHSKNIVFRDLKPDNVGFDLHDTIKIFDFGLARDLESVSKSGEILGFTGTPRYMANEIGEGQRYGLQVDVYSFGILLWQLCTLKDPFEDMVNIEQFHQWIVRDGRRPDTRLVKQQDIRGIMMDCWQPEPELRPSFQEIRTRLEFVLQGEKAPSSSSLPPSSEAQSQQHQRLSSFTKDDAALKWTTSSLHTDTASSRGSSMWDSRGSRNAGSRGFSRK